MSDIVQTLRDFGKAYPEDQFRPLTPGEIRLNSAIVTRVSAAMGRHCAKFMGEAADEIDKLRAERDKLRAELECERMRLAACGVVALADTPESATKARDMLPEYRSASCDDVARRVDECMKLRVAVTALVSLANAVEARQFSVVCNDVGGANWFDARTDALRLADEAMTEVKR